MTTPAQKRAFGLLKGKGYPDHVAAGLVGNLAQESGPDLNTQAVGDNGNAYGAGQWNGPRKRAFFEWARTNNRDATRLESQIDFLDHEMNTTERSAREAIFAAPDARSAALIASQKFWRPGDPRNKNRVRYAEAAMEFAGGDGAVMNDATPARSRYFESADGVSEGAGDVQAEGRSGYFFSREEADAQSGGETPAPAGDMGGEQGFDGVADGTMRSVQDGFFMGMGDNVGAAMGAVAGANPKSGRFFDYEGSSDPTDDATDMNLAERYRANLELERSKRAAFEEAHPNIDMAAKIGGAVVGGAGLAARAPVAVASTLPGRAGQAAAAGGGLGAVTGAAEADGPNESRLMSGAVGAAGGAAGGLAGIPLGAVASRVGKAFGGLAGRVFSRPGTWDEATDTITDEGRRRLLAIGVDPEAVSRQLAEAFDTTARKAVKGGGDPERMATAGSFGIPLTRGQATGDVPQIAAEEAMRAGARGQGAYDKLQAFDGRQSAALAAARGKLLDEVAPGAGAVDIADAGQLAIDGVRRSAAAAKEAGSKAYEAFREMGGGVDGKAWVLLDRKLAQAFDKEFLDIDPDMTNTRGAIKYLGRVGEMAQRGAVPFDVLERGRQALRNFTKSAFRGSVSSDERAMQQIMEQYDEWLETAVDSALVDGSAEALSQVKKARGLWSDYLKTFTGKKGADNMIRKIVEDEISPDQVMGWLIGASKNIGGGQSSLIANRFRDILGADSPEFFALKKAAFDRMTTKADKMLGPDAIASSLGEFLHGKGRLLAKEMFTPKELTRIGEFRAAMQVLQKPQKATNPSGSGYEATRAAQRAFQGIVAALGFAGGGAGGAAAGYAGSKVASDFTSGMAARAATRGITGPAPRIGLPVGVGAASGGQAAEVVR